MWTPLPPVQSITYSFKSVSFGLTIFLIPQAFALSIRRELSSDATTSAPASWKSCAAKFPTKPSPIIKTVSPGCTVEDLTALILTPAIRAKTTFSPAVSLGTGKAKRTASAFTKEAWSEKLNTRSPFLHMVTPDPISKTSPKWPYPVFWGYMFGLWTNGISWISPVKPAPSVPALMMEYSDWTKAWCGAKISSISRSRSSALYGWVKTISFALNVSSFIFHQKISGSLFFQDDLCTQYGYSRNIGAETFILTTA